MSGVVVDKKARKVYVRMHDGSRLVGAMYMAPDERLQDVMNDERSFLPIYLDDTKEHHPVVMVSKRYIQQVEEITGTRIHSEAEAPVTKPAPSAPPASFGEKLELE